MAVSLRVFVCLVILLVLFSSSIARPLPHSITLPIKGPLPRSNTLPVEDKDDMIGQVKEMFKKRMHREDVIRSYYVSDRVSPGGPDPHHH
uniref:CLAVATA3/ESR (CLE)-related protein n=1 Tax=Chenopodium quinoa TaxID=63459 RepID=A0A803LVQ5_CHEQI